MHSDFRKYYFIENFDTKNLNNQDKDTIIIYRNYKQDNFDIDKLIKLRNFCKKKNLKFLLSNNFKLAIKLKLDGAYIPSFNKELKHLSYSLKTKFIIIGSAHNLKELRLKEIQKVSSVVLSSIFKEDKNFLGLYKFQFLKKLNNKNIIPLGGINRKNLKFLRLLNFKSFAGISYFQKKRPLKNKGPFK